MNTINDDTVNLVKEFEGCVLTAYPDPGSGGKPWTIGYGHTGYMSMPLVNKGDTISEAEAEQYLRNDLNAAGAIVARYVTVELNDNQYGALTSFTLNVGESTFAKSSVLTYVNNSEFDKVPGRLALYRLADGKVLNGLVRRRQAEGALWLKPVVNEAAPTTVEKNTTAGSTITPDQNGKSNINVPAIGGLVTLFASLSGDVKTIIGNITETVGLNPSIVLLIVGVGFGGYMLWKHVQKDK